MMENFQGYLRSRSEVFQLVEDSRRNFYSDLQAIDFKTVLCDFKFWDKFVKKII